MYDAIRFTIDGSEAAEAATEQAIGQAQAFDATLHILYVVEVEAFAPMQITLGSVMDRLEDEVSSIIQDVAEQTEAAGVDVVSEVTPGIADGEILAYADEQDIVLIVMETHGRRGGGSTASCLGV
jgi:nucleotide-binding universal stress UspA family protein